MKIAEAEINVLLGKFGFGKVESYREIMDAPVPKAVKKVAPVKTVGVAVQEIKTAKKKAQAPPKVSKLKSIFKMGKGKKKTEGKSVKSTITDFFDE